VSRRRVLFVCHNHPKVRPGGAEAYAYELHRALRSSPDWEPTFVARSGPPLSRTGRPHAGSYFVPVDGAPDEYFVYGEDYDFDWFMGTMRHSKEFYTRHFRAFLRAIKPDVVHFQHTLFLGYDLLREVRNTLPDAAIVYTLHEFLPICHNNGQLIRTMDSEPCAEATPRRCHECFPAISQQTFFLRRRFIQAQLGLVDLFIAPSAFLRERFIDWGLPPEKVLLEEYGRSLLPAIEAPAPRRHRDRFAFFGQLSPYKGVDVLLEAMRIVEEEEADADPAGPRPRMRIHGANLDLQQHTFQDRFNALLEATAASTTFGGGYRHEQLSGLMASIDWVVVPSIWWENSPLVIQEAFIHGKPVICSDIGGMAEKVTDGVNGLHFGVRDPASLAAAIRTAAHTPGLWDRLREGIPRIYPMAEHVEVVSDLYARLVDGRTAPAVTV
jgi:glycosyltransferase involved in cell wall biosynthesis